MHNITSDQVTIESDALPFQQIPNWILDSDISAQAIRLYLYFQKYGNNKTKVSFWSRKKMASEVGVSPATLDRAKKELIDIGALCQVNRVTEDENYTSNMYHVHWDKNLNCQLLLSKEIKNDDTYTASDETYTASDDTPILTGDELTYNHLELTTKELSPRIFDDEVYQACNLFADLIEANGSKRPTVSDKWLTDMERLHRIDGRSWEQINAAIRWVQNDSFWRANVMSPDKLRKQYDALRLRAQGQQKQSAVTKTINWLTNINWDDQNKELER